MTITKQDGKLRVVLSRYDFARGTKERSIREIDIAQIVEGNPLLRHILKAPRNGRAS